MSSTSLPSCFLLIFLSLLTFYALDVQGLDCRTWNKTAFNEHLKNDWKCARKMLYKNSEVSATFSQWGKIPATNLNNAQFAKKKCNFNSEKYGDRYVALYLAAPRYCVKDTDFCAVQSSAYWQFTTSLTQARCSRTYCWFNPSSTCQARVPELKKWDKYGLTNVPFYLNLRKIKTDAQLANGGWAPSRCREKTWFARENLVHCPVLVCNATTTRTTKRVQVFDALSNLLKSKKNIGGGHNTRMTFSQCRMRCDRCTEPDKADAMCGGQDMDGNPLCCSCSLYPFGNDDDDYGDADDDDV